MNFINRNWQKLVLFSYISIVPVVSFAVDIDGTPADQSGRIVDPLGGQYADIPDFIKHILEGVLKIGMPLIALAVIYCGFLFVQAQGNSEKLSKAKDALLYTLIGAGILLGSWAIAQMINATVTSLS